MVAVAYRGWSFTRGSNCKALTGKILVSFGLAVAYGRWSLTRGGRTWRFDCSYLHGRKSRKCSRNMPACLRSHENTKKKMPVFQASAKKTSLHQPLIGSHFSSYRQLELLEYYPGPRGFVLKFFFAKERESHEETF